MNIGHFWAGKPAGLEKGEDDGESGTDGQRPVEKRVSPQKRRGRGQGGKKAPVKKVR